LRFVRYGEDFDGEGTYVFAWEQPAEGPEHKGKMVPVTAWVDPDRGRFVQIVWNFTGIYTQGLMPAYVAGPPRAVEVTEFVMTIRHSKVRLDPVLNAKDFDFTPPAEAKPVQRFNFAELSAAPNVDPPPRFDSQKLQLLIPKRDSNAAAELIDLSRYYNAPLTEPWQSGLAGNDLSALPRGLQEFGGVRFDVRGIVQLAGGPEPYSSLKYPKRVEAMTLNRKCARLHFLHGAGWTSPEGTLVGRYVVHYADGQQRVQPLFYGYELQDWWIPPANPTRTGLAPVWTGTNTVARRTSPNVYLYKTTWTNPRPDALIESVDFISSLAESAPFLLALTAE
jgi:hypothetical protein